MKSSIVKKLHSNNENTYLDGLKELYDEYYKLVYFCIIGIVKNPQDTEELANDVFLKIFNIRKSLDSDKNLKYFVTTIAKNLAIDFIRRKKDIFVYNEDYVLNYVNIKEESNYTFNELITMLKEYLNEEEISIIIYHFLYNETFEHIAKKMNKNASTIRTIYYRSLKKVKI